MSWFTVLQVEYLGQICMCTNSSDEGSVLWYYCAINHYPGGFCLEIVNMKEKRILAD